jgi:hypothetical protein
MPIFHFQFQGEGGWEPIGAGEGRGDDALDGAFADLRELSGGTLPAGTYQVIESRSSNALWQTFEVGGDSEIVDDYAASSWRGR